MFYIYKITNKVNNKVYIGQVYNKSIQDRFKRHIHGASPDSTMYICRAIYKYGHENFVIEEIDRVTNEDINTEILNTNNEELIKKEKIRILNDKEIYWIKVYNSTNRQYGYNLTPGGEGGNTYLCKTKEELDNIKHKISKSNTGVNNGMSHQIKAINITTNQIYNFDTLFVCLNFLGIHNKGVVMSRVLNNTPYLWRGIWNFAFQCDDFTERTIAPKRTHFGSRKCILINKLTNEQIQYKTISEARKNSSLIGRDKENSEYKIIDLI